MVCSKENQGRNEKFCKLKGASQRLRASRGRGREVGRWLLAFLDGWSSLLNVALSNRGSVGRKMVRAIVSCLYLRIPNQHHSAIRPRKWHSMAKGSVLTFLNPLLLIVFLGV